MNIFPLGTTAGSSNSGTIGSVDTYTFFEPNSGCDSQVVKNILVSSYENQTKVTRKKSDPYLTLIYRYENIFSREFRQIEHFIDSVADDALNSFYAPDLSKGLTPSNIEETTDPPGDWKVYIDDTRLFSTIENMKADRAFLWDGRGFMEGRVTSIVANNYMIVDITTGNLSLADAKNGLVYPLYCVYATKGALSQFKDENYVLDDINRSNDGGFTKSGDISFVSKYKV